MFLLWTSIAAAGEPVLTVRSSADWVALELAWADDREDALHTLDDGRQHGDSSTIHFDFDGDGGTSAGDRAAIVGLWPEYPGLYISDYSAPDRHKPRRSEGGKAVVLHGDDGRRDTFLVARSEFPKDTFTVRFEMKSPADERDFASKPVQITLSGTDAIDPAAFADDLAEYEASKLLAVGDQAPELHGEDWTAPPPEGPVLVAFWATWCGPCVASIPKLNELHAAGQPVVGLTEQNLQSARSKARQIQYPAGFASKSVAGFGLEGRGLPHYFVLDADRRVVWYDDHFDLEEVEKLLAALR